MTDSLLSAMYDVMIVSGASIGLCAFVSALVVVGILHYRSIDIGKHFKSEFFRVLAVAVPFCLIGMCTGFMTGASRSPAVAAVVPAILTFMSGFAVYLTVNDHRSSIVANIAIVCLSITLLLGTMVGTYERTSSSSLSKNQLMKDAVIEDAVNTYRKAIRLPPIKFQGQQERKVVPSKEQ